MNIGVSTSWRQVVASINIHTPVNFVPAIAISFGALGASATVVAPDTALSVKPQPQHSRWRSAKASFPTWATQYGVLCERLGRTVRLSGQQFVYNASLNFAIGKHNTTQQLLTDNGGAACWMRRG